MTDKRAMALKQIKKLAEQNKKVRKQSQKACRTKRKEPASLGR